MKKTIIATLLISGLSTFAGEAPGLSNSEFLGSNERAVTKTHKKDLLKVGKPAIFSASGKEWSTDEITSSGLFVNVSIFFPSSSYLNPDYALNGQKLYKVGFDAEVGNYFRFLKLARISVGLRATWFSAGFTSYSETLPFVGTVSAKGLTASIARVGPQASFALSDDLALDLFYQLGVQYAMNMVSVVGNSENASYLGVSHEFGIGVRYHVFNLGLGYRFGGLKNIHNSDGSDTDDASYSVNNLRIILGVKF